MGTSRFSRETELIVCVYVCVYVCVCVCVWCNEELADEIMEAHDSHHWLSAPGDPGNSVV